MLFSWEFLYHVPEQKKLQYCQNLTGYLELLFVYLGGPEKCSFIFCFSLFFLGKIVGSWKKVFSNVKVPGASILIFLSWKNTVRSLQIKKRNKSAYEILSFTLHHEKQISCHILVFTMGKLKMIPLFNSEKESIYDYGVYSILIMCLIKVNWLLDGKIAKSLSKCWINSIYRKISYTFRNE